MQSLHDRDEAEPHLCTRIITHPNATLDELADLRPAGSGERLAGWPARNKVDLIDPPPFQVVEEVGGVAQIPDVPETA